LQRLEL